MEYRIGLQGLMDRLSAWNSLLGRQVRLIACGGTAMTLLGVKDSTKDIDLLVPDSGEYKYLLGILEQAGYKSVTAYGWARDDGFVFDLFPGKRVYMTELLDSPLDANRHTKIKEFSRIYLGALNYYDLVITKIFRYTQVDIDDCLALIRAKKGGIDLKQLEQRYRETASYDTSDAKYNKNLEYFLETLKDKGLNDG